MPVEKSNIKEFIQKSTLIHGDKYDYSKVNYVNAHTKITIICKEHEEFEQIPHNHLKGNGCNKCVDRTKRRSNVEDFILKSKKLHKGKYDYSKFIYINCKTKGIIICKEHGDFEQHPSNHLTGRGCKNCSVISTHNLQRKLTPQFINEAKQIHGELYDYSKVEYNGNKNNIIIICSIHGEYEQMPSNHLKGYGCYKCGKISMSKTQSKTQTQFINEAIEIHGDKYDYSKVYYVNSCTKITIICKEHGEYEQEPQSHLQGTGCFNCGLISSSDKRIKTTEEFINEAIEIHGDKYDYSKVEYNGSKNNIIIICKKHGEYEQNAHNHLTGRCCFKCSGRFKNTDDFIKEAIEIHGELYDYSKVNYINAIGKVEVICKNHGAFLTNLPSHISKKTGCPLCVNKTEGKLYKMLQQSYPSTITQFKQEWCKKISYLPFDFCIQELKIIIELDGLQHFQQVSNWSSPEEQFKNDIYKQKCANENGYSVIRLLQEDVFNDSYDWNKELCEAIENIKNNNDFKNVYLCKKCEYNNYN